MYVTYIAKKMKLRGSLWTGHVAKSTYFESIQNFVGKSRGTLLFGRLRWKWKINWTWIVQKSTAKCLGRLMASRWCKIREFCVNNFENSALVSEFTHFILKLSCLGTGLEMVLHCHDYLQKTNQHHIFIISCLTCMTGRRIRVSILGPSSSWRQILRQCSSDLIEPDVRVF